MAFIQRLAKSLRSARTVDLPDGKREDIFSFLKLFDMLQCVRHVVRRTEEVCKFLDEDQNRPL